MTVGHPAAPEPDVLSVSLRPGDVYPLCSDGLAEQLPYDRLALVLGRADGPRAKVSTLLTDSLDAGGRDNATAVVIGVRSTS